MKKNIAILLFITFSLMGYGQDVISTAGNVEEGVSWTIGEIMTETVSRPESMLLQGFGQPLEVVSTGVIKILEIGRAHV